MPLQTSDSTQSSILALRNARRRQPVAALLLVFSSLIPSAIATEDGREAVRKDTARRVQKLWEERSKVSAAASQRQGLLAPTGTSTQKAKLLGTGREKYDWDGDSVAISGDTTIIGGDGDAFIFVRNGSGWDLQARLVPDGGEYGAFGEAVDIEGDTAIVGAWQANGAQYSTGAVYIFVRSGTTWTQQAKITSVDSASGDGFGYGVALSGNTALIGAPFDDGNRGSGYVYLRNGNAWTQQAKLVGFDGASGDRITWGEAIALDGDTAVLGSWERGFAYVFFRIGSFWSQQAKLTAPSNAVGFGRDMAVAGNIIVANSGHVFERVGSIWVPRANFADYKTSVAFDGAKLIAGNYVDPGVVSGTGAAYIYHWNGVAWIEGEKLIASDGAYLDSFGASVDIGGAFAVVGAPLDDDMGSAYVFQVGNVPPPGPTTPGGLRFVSMTPCRVMETRAEYNFQGRVGSFGPPFMKAGETRTLTMPNSNVCAIPLAAKSYVLNVTLVPRGGVEFVTLWPGGEARPSFWTVRSPDAQIVANTAIVKAGPGGTIHVYASHDTDILVDISGYFTDYNPLVTNLAYYPLTPCRVVDTRALYRPDPGPFGPPAMEAQETRRFKFPGNPYCPIPTGAAAYSVTLTAVPPQPLAFMTAWPAGESQPNVSNINSPAGRILANSVIVPASADGSIDVYAFNKTDFLVDINGYFAPDDGINGLYYYPVTQCRVSDSTGAVAAPYGGPIFENETTRSLPLPASACAGVPVSAKAFALNVTAMPGGSPMPFLTVYPTGQPQPNASVLNAFEGQVVTNSAIIPAGTNGSVNVYAFRKTHVALEVSGYFGR